MKYKKYSLKRNQILAHRGLEPSKENFYSESSYEAFRNHLERGFGIEFDVNFTKDNKIVIFHDIDLKRITRGKNRKLFKNISFVEIRQIELENGRLCSFEELMKLIIKSPSLINAIHLRGRFQQKKYLDILLNELQKYQQHLERVLIFDVKPKTAKYLLARNNHLILAPSVSHKYDIRRYNFCVSGTLISLEEAIKYRKLYSWAWLDEWDRNSEKDKEKKFYTKENFKKLKSVGYKIAVVAPELHNASPGLLGGEAHQDAKNSEDLFRRIKEIANLQPDAICTDYPERVITL